MAEYVNTTLEKFKNLVNSKATSPARANLYSFNIASFPQMLIGSIDTVASDLLTSHYAVSVAAPPKNIMTNPVIREHAHYEMPYGVSYEPLNVTFYMDASYTLRSFFDAWYNLIYDYVGHGFEYKDNYTSDIVLSAITKNNEPVYHFNLYSAYPKSISSINYDAQSSGDIITFNVEFQYERMEDSREAVNPYTQASAPTSVAFGTGSNSTANSSNINPFELPTDVLDETSIAIKNSGLNDVLPYSRDYVSTDDTYSLLNGSTELASSIINIEKEIFGSFTP